MNTDKKISIYTKKIQILDIEISEMTQKRLIKLKERKRQKDLLSKYKKYNGII